MTAPILAEAFPVGEHIADELDARGWTQADFAEILGRPQQFVSEIISGKKELTRESASQIATAFEMSAAYWLNLQDTYLLWKQSQDEQHRNHLAEVELRAKVNNLCPLRILVERGFISKASVTEQIPEILSLLEIESLEEQPQIRFAARRTNKNEQKTMRQIAWVACVKKLSQNIEVESFSPTKLEKLARSIATMLATPRNLIEFPDHFADAGVKLVYVESFPGGKLDGCSMLVDDTPIIGISGRGKRLDKVLFTLAHEIAHVLLGHLNENSVIIDEIDDSGEINEIEKEADELAKRFTLPHELPEIPARITRIWVEKVAQQMKIHPIVLIGRLQKEGYLPWKSTLAKGAPSAEDYLDRWGIAHQIA